MKRTVSRRLWIVFGASVVLGGVAALGPRLLPVPAVDRSARAALVAERAALARCDDGTLQELRRRLAGAEAGAWTERRLYDLQSRLGPDWRWREGGQDGAWKECVIKRVDVPLGEWAAFMDLARLLQREDGLVLAGLEIAATGEGAGRRFARVSLRVRLRWVGRPNPAGTASPASGSGILGGSDGGVSAGIGSRGRARCGAAGGPWAEPSDWLRGFAHRSQIAGRWKLALTNGRVAARNSEWVGSGSVRSDGQPRATKFPIK